MASGLFFKNATLERAASPSAEGKVEVEIISADEVPESIEDEPPKESSWCKVPALFQALKHPNYRLLWFGNLISQSGDWMDQVAFSWLIFSMTNSTVWLAMINVCRAGPIMIFTLLGGVVADRVERRNLLFTTQFILMILAFLLAGLYTSKLLQVWMAFAIAICRGITASFNQPARQSLISELVPEEDLPNAIALNSATMNLTKVIGPTSGGILIAAVGVDGAFYCNAVSYIAVLCSLYFMELPPRTISSRDDGILNDLKEGFQYIRKERALLSLIFLALMPMVFGQPYQTMLTVFASADVFDVGSTGLGVMQSVAAVGSVSGAILMASTSKSHYFVHKMLIGLIGFGGMILLFSLAPKYWMALPALLGIGLCMQTYQTSNNTLLQLKVDPEYRARVLSMLFLQRGLVPVGTMLVGFLAGIVGPRASLAGMAIILLILSGITYPIALPVLSKLMPTEVELGAGKGRRGKGKKKKKQSDVELDTISPHEPLINGEEHQPAEESTSGMGELLAPLAAAIGAGGDETTTKSDDVTAAPPPPAVSSTSVPPSQAAAPTEALLPPQSDAQPTPAPTPEFSNNDSETGSVALPPPLPVSSQAAPVDSFAASTIAPPKQE